MEDEAAERAMQQQRYRLACSEVDRLTRRVAALESGFWAIVRGDVDAMEIAKRELGLTVVGFRGVQ